MLNSCAQACVWPTIECERLSLLRRGTTPCIWRNESRLIDGRAARATTLEQATLKSKASQMAVAPQGRRHCGQATMVVQQAYSGHGQQGHRHCGRATYFCFISGPTGVTANKGTRLWASYQFFLNSKPNGGRAMRA